MVEKKLCLEYLEFLNNYSSVIKDFIEIEKKKFEMLSNDQLDGLDDCVKQEEVYLLKTRGLEQERIKYMERLGCSGYKFRQLIPVLPKELQSDFINTFNDMTDSVKELKRLNLQANSAAKIRLQQIEKIIEKLENNSQQNSGYTNQAQKEGKSTSFISKKI